VADVPDGLCRADARAGPPLPPVRPGDDPLRHRAIHDEAARIYRVIDRRLSESEYIAADDYTLADVAVFPWLVSHENQGQDLADYPNLERWYEAVEGRPAVGRGLAVGAELRRQLNRDMDEKTRETLFGNKK
jgi:GST-like protein